MPSNRVSTVVIIKAAGQKERQGAGEGDFGVLPRIGGYVAIRMSEPGKHGEGEIHLRKVVSVLHPATTETLIRIFAVREGKQAAGTAINLWGAKFFPFSHGAGQKARRRELLRRPPGA